MKKHLLLLFFFVCSFIFGQNKKMDSLQTLLNFSKEDTTRLRLYLKLGAVCDTKDNLKYAQPALQLADKLLSKSTEDKLRKSILKQKATAYMLSGIFYFEKDEDKRDSSKALEFYLKALEIREAISDGEDINQSYDFITNFYKAQRNFSKVLEFRFRQIKTFEVIDPSAIANCYNEIGNDYSGQYNYLKALEYYLKSLKASEDLGDIRMASVATFNITEIYMGQSNYDKALEYYFKNLKIWEKLGNKWGVGNCCEGIGLAYLKQSNYVKSLEYQKKAMNIYLVRPDSGGWRLPIIYNNVGLIYQGQSNYEKALEYFLKSLKMMKRFNLEGGIMESYSSLCGFYNKLGDYKKAILYGDSALNIIKKRQAIGIESTDILNNMAIAYSKTGRYKEAFEYYFKYKSISDSMFNGRNSNKINDLVNDFETKKRDAEQAKLDAIGLEHKKQQQVIIYAVAAVLLLVIIFSSLLYKRFRLTNKQKNIIEIKSKEIEEKNKDITDSINYAKRIQNAKLPRKEEIFADLPNCFVLFKPKDIVSGDFYFYHKSKQSVFIAAADCTGHGVPGAFMSMIGSERLEDAVSNSNDTSEILKLLNKGIKTSLRQSDSNESTRDGMDIALCSVDTKNCIVKFAGANRPLYIVRKGQTEVEEIKATKKAIGGLTEDDQHFDTHEIKLQQGDTFYISTDGYADQFSSQDKKLTTKKLKQMLLEIQDKTMPEQEIHLDNFIEDWKSGIEQIDDILVIGVRL